MPKLILIRGLPGSGKSTLAQTFNAQHIEADMYFINPDGAYLFDPSQLTKAHHWCLTETEKCLSMGVDVVVSNTFVQQWELKPYKQLAKKYQASLEILISKGSWPNVHQVPDQVIERMRQDWQD